jgi:gliding motility-associated-like protein
MKYFKFIYISLFFTLFIQRTVTAQNVGACNNSQNFCTNPSFPMTVGGTGLTGGAAGNISNPFTNPQGINSGCMFANVPGPQWMVLTVSSNGMLGFSLGANGSPNPQMGYYDWILWPITGGLANACTQLFSNNLPPVSCNWNATTIGGTGMGTIPAGGNPGNYQPSIPVTAGQQFIFLFSNYSGVNGNVTFQSTGSAGLTCSPLVAPSITLCPGAVGTTTANWLGVTNPITYTLNPGGIIQTSPIFNFTAPVNTTSSVAVYTLLASSTNTSGGAIQANTTFSVFIAGNPSITVSNNTFVCQNESTNLSATLTAPGNPTAYAWSGPGAFSSNVQSPLLANMQPTNSGVYTVTSNINFMGKACPRTNTVQITVIPTNSITITAAPASTLCQGATLNLSASAVGASSYSWSGPSSFTSGNQSPSIAGLMPTNSGNYTTTAFFSNSASTLVCTRTVVSNYSVVSTSSVTVSLPNNVCQYGTATLNAVAPGAIGFSWTGPNNYVATGATGTISNIPTNASGPYYATALFAIGTVSCTTIGSNNLSVVPVNPINVIPQISQCEPANISLQANSAGAATYSWTGPNSYTSNVSNPQMYGLLPNASGIYTVTTSYNNGNLICYNTNTTNVTINPKLNFTLTPYTLGCFNSLLNVNGPAGATSYTWTGSSGFTSNTQNLNIPFVQANQSGIYTLEVMLGPCKTSGSTRVDILDPLKFDKTPTNKTICRGEAVTFTMQSVGGSGNYAYVWNPPLYVGSPTGSVQSGNPLGTTIYNVTGYDIACPNYTINHTFTLTVNQPPQPNLNLEKVSGCQPLCLLYNSKTQSEASTTTYDFGNGIKFQADSIRYCIDVPGVYNLKIHSTGNNGCKGTYDYPLPITVYPKPGSSINHNPEYITLSDNQVVFNPSHQAGPIVSTNWIFLGTKESMNGQIDSSGIRNPERVFETAGKYPVMLVSTTDKGCVDSVVKFIEVNEDFSVYIPNTFTPNGDGVNDVFMVKGTGMKIENYTMEIFDRWGTMLYSSKDITKGWDGSAKGAQLPIGAYIYKVKVIGANGQGKKEYVGHVTLMK